VRLLSLRSSTSFPVLGQNSRFCRVKVAVIFSNVFVVCAILGFAFLSIKFQSPYQLRFLCRVCFHVYPLLLSVFNSQSLSVFYQNSLSVLGYGWVVVYWFIIISSVSLVCRQRPSGANAFHIACSTSYISSIIL
jgi:hypothetical protein